MSATCNKNILFELGEWEIVQNMLEKLLAKCNFTEFLAPFDTYSPLANAVDIFLFQKSNAHRDSGNQFTLEICLFGVRSKPPISKVAFKMTNDSMEISRKAHINEKSKEHDQQPKNHLSS